MNTKLSLPDFCRERRVSYRRVYEMVLEGIIPVERVEGRRYAIREADLPSIEKTLMEYGLLTPKEAA